MIAANIWRGVPFVAITLLAGLQTISPSLLRGGGARRRDAVAAVPLRHAAAADADHRRRDDVLGAVHVHRLPADLRAHARRPAQRDAPDGDAVVPARDLRAAASAKARRSRPRWCRSCSRRSCSATSACSAARWQQGGATSDAMARRTRRRSTDTQGMNYLESLPRARRHASTCRSRVFLIVLLFPFYWMAITAFKPNDELLSREGNPFWVIAPDARPLPEAAVRHRVSRTGCGTRCWSRSSSTFLSLVCSVLAAYAIERLRFRGAQLRRPGDLPRLPGAAVDPVHPARGDRLQARPLRHALALILTYPTFLIPFCTWLLMGYFRSIPLELEECALIDGATAGRS